MNNAKNIRRAVVIGVLLALAVYPLGLSAKEKFEQKFEKIEDLARDGKIVLSNISGSIEIRIWAEAKVKIEANKVSEAKSLDKAKENADKVQIVVDKTGGILRIETKYPDQRDRNESLSVSVFYKVWVPEKASLKVKSVSGGLSVEGLGGALESNTVSGNVTLSGITGDVDSTVTSGTVNVSDVVGAVSLRTISGGITAERIKGSVEAETTSGAIHMRDIVGAKSVRAKVLSGNIDYEGDLAKDGKYILEALSGRLEMTVPANSGFDLEAETFSGGIQSDFQVTVSGRLSAKALRGVVNNGGASVRLKSFSGSISLKKK
ncbi:MAG: DUF4097 family beta strand repeat-containing protein [Candidatus Aminicenantales bacterium]|jgi:hypothetical protein